MSARNWTLGLAVGAVLAAAAPTALAAPSALAAPPGAERPAAASLRAPLPGGLGPCAPAPPYPCPDPYPPIGTDAVPKGRDNGVNIFVGGDFRVRERVSEAEGRIVVLGDFDQDKSGPDRRYNVGIVGAGSLVPPPPGADFLTTGGDITVAPGQRLLADTGAVRYAGTLTGTVTGTLRPDPAAVAPYAGLRDRLSEASQCYARVGGQPRPATGTAVNEGHRTVLRGDGASRLQVFTVDADLAGPRGAQQGIVFERIPAGATILVNVLGDARTVSTYSGGIQDTDPLNAHRERLLWNFPDATRIDLNGTGQFQGSFLMGRQDSQTAVRLPGINGRFFTTGSLTHTSDPRGGGGQEFHAYPFNGDLPDCGPGPQPVTGAVSVLKHDEAGGVLSGARFELWRESNGRAGAQFTGPDQDTRLAECTTGDDGLCTQDGLAPGLYYWRETAAPAGYELPADPVFPVRLTEQNAPAGARAEAVNSRRPDPATVEVTLRKTGRAGAPLPGARFELWRESNGRPGLQTDGGRPDTRLEGSCLTGDAGTCTVELPAGGSYYWRETSAPDGYALPADPVTPFDVDEADAAGALVVDVANEPEGEDAEGSIRVLKKDAKTGRPLRGAVFEVWKETNGTAGLQTRGINADRSAGPGCATDRSGACEFTGLEQGAYYLLETAVPEGYVLPAERVTGPLRLDADTPEHRLVVTVENARDDHGKGGGKGGTGSRA
ncbi:choice-of-anchor A family protein [Streptomyces sp. cmx-4-9]|uniref:choice-of-anchor A family protein n=1 Tax=Streptomyces sp. cmx-4-9 TaxID=2790941 RepID=UPI00397EEB7E